MVVGIADGKLGFEDRFLRESVPVVAAEGHGESSKLRVKSEW